MISRLDLDLETFSETPIKDGTHRYAAAAEIMLFAYSIDDGPVKVWDATAEALVPQDLMTAICSSCEIWAQNSAFDRTVLRTASNTLPAFVKAAEQIDRWRDTMVQAYANALPGSLGQLCDVLGVPTDQAKDKDGRKLIMRFCKPQPKNMALRRATADTHPADWAKFKAYAAMDIVAMQAIRRKLPKWNYAGAELALWHLDQTINDRGVAIDLELAECAVAAVTTAQTSLAAQTMVATEGQLASTTRRDGMLAYVLSEYGVDLPDIQMATLERRIQDPELPEGLRELLRIRLQASTTSTTKYKTLMRGTSDDGRLRGLLQFCGASRTGRWAGRLWQPQNLPRSSISQAEIDSGIDALKAGCADLVVDNVMQLASSAIRGCIVAPAGKKLVVADLSNIEGRDQAWLAGEEWKLSAFRDYDRIIGVDAKGEPLRAGPDLYKLAYGKAFNVAIEDVTKDQRQVGKVMELACFAAETRVITNHGVKRITDVEITDLLWDGNSWVKHQGLVARGVRQVVSVAGIEVTPDHLVLTGQTWTPARQLVMCESTLSQALATGSANSWLLRSSGCEGVPATSTWLKSNAPAAPSRIWSTTITCAAGLVHGAGSALKSRLNFIAKTSGGMPTLFPIWNTAGVFSIESRRVSIAAITQKMEAMPATAGGASPFSKLGAQIDARICSISSRLTAGINRNSTLIGSTSTAGTNPVTSASLPEKKTAKTNDRCAKCSSESLILKPTFDILNAGSRHRFTILTDRGPLIVHNCGYEGGVGAFATFAAAYGIDLDGLAEKATIPAETWSHAERMLEWHREQKRNPIGGMGMSEQAWLTCESFKLGWREAHPNIAKYWKQLDKTVRMAISNPGVDFTCKQVTARRDKAWLRIVLPSGRAICYPAPKFDDGKITYMGIHQYTRQWTRFSTYGGKIFENVCQAVARDVMAHNMPAIEAAGYQIVLTVHDEIIAEAPDRPEFNEEHLASLLAANPPWAPDMPLAAAGFQCTRYRKD
jgi:hypothetical protein